MQPSFSRAPRKRLGLHSKGSVLPRDPLRRTYLTEKVESLNGRFRYAICGSVFLGDISHAVDFLNRKHNVRIGVESGTDWPEFVLIIKTELVVSLDQHKEEVIQRLAELICEGAFEIRKITPEPAPVQPGAHQVAAQAELEDASKNILASEATKEKPTKANRVPAPSQRRKNQPRRARKPKASTLASGPTPYPGHVPDFVQADWAKACPRPRFRDKQGRLSRGRHRVTGGNWWLLHMLVLAQKCSAIVIPDVLLGQTIWGGDRKQWPPNWRRDLGKKFRGSKGPLRPCPSTCFLHGSSVRHQHFHCTIKNIDNCQDQDQTFLGALESYGYADDQGQRCYDWAKPSGPNEAYNEAVQKLIEQDRKAGRLAAVYLPVLLFGAAPRMKLSYEQRQLLLAITHEVTRVMRSSRADKAQIITGGQSSVGSSGARVGVYPGLQAGESYVAFNGNASHRRRHLRGRGYHLIGRSGKGWLAKAGYGVPEDDKGKWKAIKRFLADLDSLAAQFGLVVAGWHTAKNEWKSLAEMKGMSSHREGYRWLKSCLLRIYTPADYLPRWREYFAAQMGFTLIPGGHDEQPPASAQQPPTTAIGSALELDGWMKKPE